jgi:hypothetical protein
MAAATKAMKTEAKRAFNCGFALAEGELRRLHDLLVQQIRRAPGGDNFQTFYELKYRNGSVGYPGSLDDVLGQENFGSAAILRFKVEVTDGAEHPANSISIEFINADEEEGSSTDSVKYRVSGDDRDWVFVTSSQLEERVGKVKLFSPNQLAARKNRIWLVLFPMVLIFSLLLFLDIGPTKNRQAVAREQLDALERDWKSGALKDPVEATIQTARIELNSREVSGREMISGQRY